MANILCICFKSFYRTPNYWESGETTLNSNILAAFCEKELQISICSSVWKRGKMHLLSPSKMLNDKTHPRDDQTRQSTKQREINTRGPAHNHTHRNLTPFWLKNKYMSNILVAGPYTIYFKLVLWLPGPRDGKSIQYISLWKYIDAALGIALFILVYKFKY